MFDSFNGKLIYKTKNKIYLENAFGLREIYVNDENLYEMNLDYHLFIYKWKRINQKSCEQVAYFGFDTIEDMCQFGDLINIEGIGTKTAIKIISKGIKLFNSILEQKNLQLLCEEYSINKNIAEKILCTIKKDAMNNLTSYQLKKINSAIANLQKIGYSREISTKVVWNRSEDVLNNNFSTIFCLLIEDIKNERINQ